MKWLKERDKFSMNESVVVKHNIPTYDECVEMCAQESPCFYETKLVLDGYNISVFNYRLAMYSDFVKPIADKPQIKAYEMRGLTFVFNEDGTIFNRFLLLEKFFNLNQVPESMYSIVKNYKIKYVNNKEDGSIASFIKLPNGKIYGKSKMSFDNDQADGINRVYKTNKQIKSLVDWCLDNDIAPIFEYVAPHNRIVLRYTTEDLILLRLRDNKTGRHIDLKDHLDKIGEIKIAPFEDDFDGLDHLIELVAKQTDKEGCIVQAVDENGHDFLFKLKTPWYCERHGLLTEDLYREHIIIGYILQDKIDDILGQIPEEEKEAHERINKIIKIAKKAIADKEAEILGFYQVYLDMNDRKAFALKYHRHPLFAMTMAYVKGVYMKTLSKEEIAEMYEGDFDRFAMILNQCESYEIAKEWLREQTKWLMMARDWLQDKDPTLFFIDPIESDEDN
jgi:RNA ligase